MSGIELDQKVLQRLVSRKASLEELEKLESNCVLDTFRYEDAFELGSLVRRTAKELFPEKCVVIDVSASNGHSIFRAVTFRGSSLDNDNWIERKRKTALRFSHSSFYMGNKKGNQSPEDKFFVDSKEYAFHGGAVPIFLSQCDYPVGCLTVSGLKQEEDHLLAVTCLTKYAQRTAPALDLD